MARGDSIIKVSIIGDVKKLVGALNDADKATGGLLKTTAKVAGGLFLGQKAIQGGFDFIQDSLHESDRLADSITNLRLQLGPLSEALIATSGNFTKLGQSKADMIELEARFADIATAAGAADTIIEDLADEAVATAAAISLLTDKTPAEALDLIAKAAGGSSKAAKELGVTLEKNVNTNTQLELILTQLKPKLDSVTQGSGDLEQKQKELQARVENLQASLGDKLAPALATVLQFINDEIDAIPHAIEGFAMLGRGVENFGRAALGPLGNVRDALAGILELFGVVQRQGSLTRTTELDITRASRNYAERNGLTGPP